MRNYKKSFQRVHRSKISRYSLGVLEIIIHTHKKFVDECFSYNENFQEYSLFHLRELMLFFFFRICLVWVEKWNDRKWREDRRDLGCVCFDYKGNSENILHPWGCLGRHENSVKLKINFSWPYNRVPNSVKPIP